MHFKWDCVRGPRPMRASILGVFFLATRVFALPSASLELNLNQSEYFSRPELAGDTKMGLAAGGGFEGKAWQGYALASGLFTLDQSEAPYVMVPEAYLSRSIEDSGWQLSLGRKRESWSALDDLWKLGIWQPMARWDYLRPVPQGLTGLFVGHREKGFQAEFLISPFFLPDQGPSFSLNNGRFASNNPWFSPPPQELLLMGQVTAINYRLTAPSFGSVVNHPGVAGKVVLGDLDNGLWARAALGVLPVNQFHLSIESYGSVSLTQFTNQAVAVLHPLVINHQVATLESGFSQDDSKFWGSLTYDAPNAPNVPDGWIQSDLFPTLFAGFGLKQKLPIFGIKRSEMGLSYLKRWQKESILTNDMTAELNSSLDRFPLKDAISWDWTVQLFNVASRTVKVGLKYLYSLPEQGSLLSGDLALMTSQNWQWELSFDLLGTSGSGGDGLISRYRTNDRVSGGVRYVF